MLKIAIVEDEEVQIDEWLKYLEKWAAEGKESVDIATYKSAEDFLYDYKLKQYDVIFVDIYLGGLSGMEMAAQIREKDSEVMIVFQTASASHALLGYEVDAMDFFVKPIEYSKIKYLMERVKKRLRNINERVNSIAFWCGRELKRVHINDIYYCVVNGHYLTVKTKYGDARSRMSISDLEKILPSELFFRCHRSYVVNLHQVNCLKNDNVIMINGDPIPISRDKRKEFKSKLMDYFFWDHSADAF